MAVLGDKENAQIKEGLKSLIENKLPDDKQGRELDHIENITIDGFEVDDKNSDRDNIVISSFQASIRFWLKNRHGGTSNDNLKIKNSRAIVFKYNEDSKFFEITNEEEIVLFNASPV